MVLLKSLVKVFVGELLLIILLDRHDHLWLRMLFEIFDVVRGVSTLHGRQIVGALVLAFPEKVFAQRLCQFSGKHVASGSSW